MIFTSLKKTTDKGMSLKIYIAIWICVFMTYATCEEERVRTVRRTPYAVDTDESGFIASFDSFLKDAEGTTSQSSWPDGVDPLNEFGLMQSTMISDMLIQLCLISGVYVRPRKNDNVYNETLANSSLPVEKKTDQGRALKSEKKEGLLEELIDLLHIQRNKRQVETTTATTTAAPYTGPPLEDWQSDPYDVLEDAEYQFTNLCYTLFDLRRLNKKQAKQATQAVKKKKSLP